jgi:Starch-binding associating with outer membrane/Susd and RagB outer membrane lipoprotein
MRLKKIYIVALSVVMLGSCNKKLDELLVNPNSPSPESASADLYLTQMQLSFANFFDGASGFGMETTRMIVMYGPTYNNAYSPQSFDGLWSTAYTGVFKHANALIPIAENEKKFVNSGMAKTLKAYTMMTLVDMFGDIPYTDANLGTDNTNPTIDKGQDVYAKAIALLDAAIVDFGKTPGAYPGNQDLFFGASNAAGAVRWKTAAKLLKLRALSNTRLVDASAKTKIDALLTDADVVASVNSSAADLEFKYSTKQTNPNSRHPRYNGNWTQTGNAGDYMGTYFMWVLVQERGTSNNSDPRSRYYFYRQKTNYANVNVNTSSCSVAPPPPHYPAGMPYCLLLQGYWGRDHGDNSGIPPDGELRSTWGIYPAGGDFDYNQATRVALNRGGNGAGVQPIWQRAFTEFVKAECALKLGTAGNPRTLLESGIRKSIDKVTNFNVAIGASLGTTDTAYVATTFRINNYVNKVLALYDAATSDDQRLNIIMKEFYIALWGNGVDANNNYRRTGKPDNMQLTRAASPGSYTRSMLYPSTLVNLNQNASQKSGVDVRVFWDNNPAGFIK